MSIVDLHKLRKIKTFGMSMFPLLKDGDIVYFKKTTFTEIIVNDIVITQKNDFFITHRVIYKTENYIITKGDNNLTADERTYKKDIVGKVEKVKRGSIEFHPEVFYAMQSSVYIKEILKVKKILHKNKIMHVFLKGLPLHLYYEKKPPRRIYADCDLLIRLDNFLEVKKHFQTLGYTIVEKSIHKKKQKTFTEISFYKNVKNVTVIFDIHIEPVFMMTQVDVKRYVYFDQLMNRMSDTFIHNSRNIIINNESYAILQPTHLIIYLALHFFHHNYKGIFRLAFLHNIITKEKKNKRLWIDIEIFITEYHLQNYVYPVFVLLQRYYQTNIPKKIIKLITPINTLQKKIGETYITDGVFNDESRLFGGINRLLLLIILSPRSIYMKLLLFINPDVISLFLAVVKKILLLPFHTSKKRLEYK